jgi:hypothetical protein
LQELYNSLQIDSLLLEQDVLDCLSENRLSKSIIDVGQLVLDLLGIHALCRLKFALNHGNHLSGSSVSHILLNCLNHGPMSKNYNSKAKKLGSRNPNVAGADCLANH